MDRRHILNFNKIHFYTESRNKALWGIVIAMALCAPFAPSFGKVFLTRRMNSDSSNLDAITGWHKIFQSGMSINGASSVLRIYGCDEPLATVIPKLRCSLDAKADNRFTISETFARIISVMGDQITTLLALDMGAVDKSVIFAISRSRAEESQAMSVPDEHKVTSDSLFSGGRLVTAISNEETGAKLETRDFDGPPGRIINEIEATLKRGGWQLVYPLPNQPARDLFLLFQRSSAACAVLVRPGLSSDRSCATFFSGKQIVRR